MWQRKIQKLDLIEIRKISERPWISKIDFGNMIKKWSDCFSVNQSINPPTSKIGKSGKPDIEITATPRQTIPILTTMQEWGKIFSRFQQVPCTLTNNLQNDATHLAMTIRVSVRSAGKWIWKILSNFVKLMNLNRCWLPATLRLIRGARNTKSKTLYLVFFYVPLSLSLSKRTTNRLSTSTPFIETVYL